MKKSFVKQLLDRRVPQILGSYFVGATTLIFFIDWLVAKYGFSDFYTSFALFGLISILPSVVILAYFHGAPGKDEWTKVEKFGIPINILFIAIALFSGYRFDVWQEDAPDHSAVYDTFLVHIESSQQGVDKVKLTDGYINEGKAMVDSIFPLSNKKLNDIRDYVRVKLKKEFMNHNIDIYFSETKEEGQMLDNIPASNYLWSLWELKGSDKDTAGLEAKMDSIHLFPINSFSYFTDKYKKHIDLILKATIYEATPNNKSKLMMMDMSNDYSLFVYENGNYKNTGNQSVIYHLDTGVSILASNDNDENIEDVILDMFVDEINDYSFGRNIGEVANILDSNLVTIKLTNLEVVRGSELICLGRIYKFNRDDSKGKALETFNQYYDDALIVYDYLVENPGEVKKLNDKLDFNIPPGEIDKYAYEFKEEIDSLKLNIDVLKAIESGSYRVDHEHFAYYLKILNIQDSIATAKITGSVFPFAYPQVGDEINVR